jgi:hypothetical protein
MEIHTNKPVVTFISIAKLTPMQLATCVREERELVAASPVAEKMDLAERFTLLDAMMLSAKHGDPFMERLLESLSGGKSRKLPANDGGLAARLFTQNTIWDPSLRKANRVYDRCVAACRIADRIQRERELKEIQNEFGAIVTHTVTTEPLERLLMGPKSRGELSGDLIITQLHPGFAKVLDKADDCEQSNRNLILAFALAAFHADHGRYPAKLAELAPKYIEKTPDDVFSGKPLIYRLVGAGYLLYSVGPDGVDDDGRSYDDEPRGDDIVVRMPVPEPKIKK